jgi:hypothetical protein
MSQASISDFDPSNLRRQSTLAVRKIAHEAEQILREKEAAKIGSSSANSDKTDTVSIKSSNSTGHNSNHSEDRTATPVSGAPITKGKSLLSKFSPIKLFDKLLGNTNTLTAGIKDTQQKIDTATDITDNVNAGIKEIQKEIDATTDTIVQTVTDTTNDINAGIKEMQKDVDTATDAIVQTVTDTTTNLLKIQKKLDETFQTLAKKASLTKDLTISAKEKFAEAANKLVENSQLSIEKATRYAVLEYVAKISIAKSDIQETPARVKHKFEDDFTATATRELKKILPKGAEINTAYVGALTHEMLEKYGSSDLPKAAIEHNGLKEIFWKTILNILDTAGDLVETILEKSLILGAEALEKATGLEQDDNTNNSFGTRKTFTPNDTDIALKAAANMVESLAPVFVEAAKALTNRATEAEKDATEIIKQTEQSAILLANAAKETSTQFAKSLEKATIEVASYAELATVLSENMNKKISEETAKKFWETNQKNIENGLKSIAILSNFTFTTNTEKHEETDTLGNSFGTAEHSEECLA